MRPIRAALMMVILAAHVADVALANGGGYAFGVTFTGDIAPFQASGTKDIHIVHEDLTVQLRRTDAAVVVRYTMRNTSNEAVSARFGFPVEAVYTNDLGDGPPIGSGEPAKGGTDATQPGLAGAVQQLKGYAVTANGAPVRAEFVTEPFATGRIKPFPGSEALQGIAGWMVSEVSFAALETLSIEIAYSADHGGDGEFVSEDNQASPLSFRYRLSTGAVWNGPIETGTVTIRVDGIPASEVEILKPRERFRRIDDQWVWEFRDLKPTLADDISVNAIPGYFRQVRSNYGPDGSPRASLDRHYLERLGKWAEGHQDFRATASSVLSPQGGHSYGPENIAKGERVPWCEGVAGVGVGEYVEVIPRTPKRLMALGFYPGFQDYEHPGLFTRNARPARVEVLLNGETTFTASIGDKSDEQLIPVVGYTKPVSRLRITIKDVYPGTSFEDTCIARLILFDLLPGDPGVGHAR